MAMPLRVGLVPALLATAAVSHLETDKTAGVGAYEQLTGPCSDPVAIGGKHVVSSVDECEQECDKQAAAAPGTGQASCRGVDTDGKACFLKSQCHVRAVCREFYRKSDFSRGFSCQL